jgi:hypothetical protein
MDGDFSQRIASGGSGIGRFNHLLLQEPGLQLQWLWTLFVGGKRDYKLYDMDWPWRA